MEQNNLPNEPQNSQESASTQPENRYLVPLSIVVAGVLIAGAVLYSRKPENQGGAQPKGLSSADIISIAEKNVPRAARKNLTECVNNREFKDRVQTDSENGSAAGIGIIPDTGTPYTVVIGKNGKRYRISGAQPYANVDKIIQNALKGIDGLDKNDPAFKARAVDPAIDHIQGNADAAVKMIEYSDLQCPFCRFFHPTMKQVMEKYGKTGEVAWIYRHFPLDNIHPLARPAAEASECVSKLGGNDAFWKFVDQIFEKGGK